MAMGGAGREGPSWEDEDEEEDNKGTALFLFLSSSGGTTDPLVCWCSKWSGLALVLRPTSSSIGFVYCKHKETVSKKTQRTNRDS